MDGQFKGIHVVMILLLYQQTPAANTCQVYIFVKVNTLSLIQVNIKKTHNCHSKKRFCSIVPGDFGQQKVKVAEQGNCSSPSTEKIFYGWTEKTNADELKLKTD